MTEYRFGTAMSVVGWLCFLLGSFALALSLFTLGESFVAGAFLFLIGLLLCWAGWRATGLHKNSVVRVDDDHIESIDWKGKPDFSARWSEIDKVVPGNYKGKRFYTLHAGAQKLTVGQNHRNFQELEAILHLRLGKLMHRQ